MTPIELWGDRTSPRGSRPGTTCCATRCSPPPAATAAATAGARRGKRGTIAALRAGSAGLFRVFPVRPTARERQPGDARRGIIASQSAPLVLAGPEVDGDVDPGGRRRVDEPPVAGQQLVLGAAAHVQRRQRSTSAAASSANRSSSAPTAPPKTRSSELARARAAASTCAGRARPDRQAAAANRSGLGAAPSLSAPYPPIDRPATKVSSRRVGDPEERRRPPRAAPRRGSPVAVRRAPRRRRSCGAPAASRPRGRAAAAYRSIEV